MSSKETGALQDTPTETQESPQDHAHADLSDFQQQVLIEIGNLQAANSSEPYGLAIKERLEAYYGETVNHGRLYPNLDRLAEGGYLEKGQIDRRTNRYRLTEAGRDALVAGLDRRSAVLHALDAADAVVDGGDA